MTALPPATDFTDASVTEAQFKTAMTNLRAFISELLGIDGTVRPSKNVIINGNFDIWQRGTSLTALASGAYWADRFTYNKSGVGVHDASRSTDTPDGLSAFSGFLNVTTADTSIAAGDLYNIRHFVEGNNAQKYGFGGADAKLLTLSFRVKATVTGTYCVSFINSANNRSYVVEYTISAANTWEDKTVTLTADTSGTWLQDSGVGIRISWALATGTTFQTAADVWTAGEFFGTSNQVNALSAINNEFRLSRVQLEIGSVATVFERRSFGQELALCQRYYAKTFPQATAPAQNAGTSGYLVGNATGTTTDDLTILWSHPVTMRADPTIVTYNPNAANADLRDILGASDVAVNIDAGSDEAVTVINNNATMTDARTHGIHASADAEL